MKRQKIYVLADDKGVLRTSKKSSSIKRTMREVEPNGKWRIYIFRITTGSGLLWGAYELVKIIIKSM